MISPMRNEGNPRVGHPELIRRITDSRRKEIKEIEQEILLKQRNPGEIAQEAAKAKAEQAEADEMFRKMRIDCENLLNSRGEIKKVGFLEGGLPGMWTKRKVLETSITDEEDEEIKVVLFSSKINPVRSSRITLLVDELKFLDTEPDFILSLERDHSYIGKGQGNTRTPNLQDAREWKEVVDALKAQ